jgi:transglutaminase-like putative cysteine protease
VTATDVRPEAGSGPVRGRPAPPAPPPPPEAELLVVAEVALASVTVAAVLALGHLFADGSFLAPVLAFALLGHGLAALCRRLDASSATTTAAGVAGLVLGVSWYLLPETTAFGLPTMASLTAAGEHLTAALEAFREASVPAPVVPGFVLAGVVGVWLIAFTADTAAFRARAPVEAAVPGATLFVFGAALAEGPLAATVPFLLALLAHWLASRALQQAALPTWLAGDARAGSRALLRAGAGLAVLSVAVAVLLAPGLPGVDADAAISWRGGDRDGSGSRVTVSPLVDIRTRIVDQADVEVFTVASDQRSYWRLTSLETFDGRIWSSSGQYRPARGALEPAVPAEMAHATTTTQEFRVGDLASIWLPAAFEPVAVDGATARYDGDSGSLLTEEETVSGLEYRVTSRIKDLEAAPLTAAPNVAPSELRDTYTALPEGFSLSVQQLAAEVAGDPNLGQYERALRLQEHFRDGSFTYDIEVEPGHGGDALERFLFETRRGYCEQYAGAYAAMARAVGLPARVAVGFTPGELEDDGRFHVRGLHGHAWPEVFLAGYGWVAFEPTPGRGIPGAEPYTGVPEQQASAEEAAGATTVPPTTAPPAGPAGGAPTTLPDLFPELGGGGVPADDGSLLARAARPLLVVAGVAVAVPLLWAAVVALAVGWRRARRRAAAETTGQRIGAAWAEVVEELARAGTPRHPWETPVEFARRAGESGPADAALLGRLARAATAAEYGVGALSEEEATAAVTAAATVERSVRADLDARGRVRRALDPRPLLAPRPARRSVREEAVSA